MKILFSRGGKTKNLLLGVALTFAVCGPATAGGYGYGYGYRGGGDDAAWALFGGLLMGGLIGYAISEDRYRSRAYAPVYGYAPVPVYAYAYEPVPVHPQRPVHSYPPKPVPPHASAAEGFGERCVMTREYTTTVYFEGAQHEAYGTRCMQSDGSWVLGPPRIAPPY